MMPTDSRWVIIKRTSPSGKTLFQCKCCGIVSIAPNKHCYIGNQNANPRCEVWEAKRILARALKDAMLPADLIREASEFVQFAHDLSMPKAAAEEEIRASEEQIACLEKE